MKQFNFHFLLVFLVGLVMGLLICKSTNHFGYVGDGVSQDSIVQTDTVTVTDTVKYEMPVPVDSVVVKYATIYDTIPVHMPSGIDTAFVAKYDIPISQKEYVDSTYHAWVSGYSPSLDSIYLYPQTEYITQTITKIKYKTKHWGLGVQMGAGYAANKFQPYVGVGIQYNFYSF